MPVKKVIDIIDIDMFVMFVVVMGIAIFAVVFGGGLRVVDGLHRRVEYYGTCIERLADEELICECYLLGRGKNAHTDALRKERL